MPATSVQMNGALAQLLGEFRGREVVALLNRGNRGDGVVHLGGRQFLTELGINARETRDMDDLSQLKGDVLLLYGAGTVARKTRHLQRVLKWIAPRFSDIVVMPDSFDTAVSSVRAMVQSWDRKYHVFCRELVSFDALRRTKAKPKTILLGHDLAFHADLSRWAERPARGSAGLFRHDAEAGYGRLPRKLESIEDASQGSEREPEPLLDFVARFSELHTDRAHAAIPAAMLGRTVVFYRNRYFKNDAIYHHSLASRPHVRFEKRAPFSLLQYFRAKYWAATAGSR